PSFSLPAATPWHTWNPGRGLWSLCLASPASRATGSTPCQTNPPVRDSGRGCSAGCPARRFSEAARPFVLCPAPGKERNEDGNRQKPLPTGGRTSGRRKEPAVVAEREQRSFKRKTLT